MACFVSVNDGGLKAIKHGFENPGRTTCFANRKKVLEAPLCAQDTASRELQLAFHALVQGKKANLTMLITIVMLGSVHAVWEPEHMCAYEFIDKLLDTMKTEATGADKHWVQEMFNNKTETTRTCRECGESIVTVCNDFVLLLKTEDESPRRLDDWLGVAFSDEELVEGFACPNHNCTTRASASGTTLMEGTVTRIISFAPVVFLGIGRFVSHWRKGARKAIIREVACPLTFDMRVQTQQDSGQVFLHVSAAAVHCGSGADGHYYVIGQEPDTDTPYVVNDAKIECAEPTAWDAVKRNIAVLVLSKEEPAHEPITLCQDAAGLVGDWIRVQSRQAQALESQKRQLQASARDMRHAARAATSPQLIPDGKRLKLDTAWETDQDDLLGTGLSSSPSPALQNVGQPTSRCSSLQPCTEDDMLHEDEAETTTSDSFTTSTNERNPAALELNHDSVLASAGAPGSKPLVNANKHCQLVQPIEGGPFKFGDIAYTFNVQVKSRAPNRITYFECKHRSCTFTLRAEPCGALDMCHLYTREGGFPICLQPADTPTHGLPPPVKTQLQIMVAEETEPCTAAVYMERLRSHFSGPLSVGAIQVHVQPFDVPSTITLQKVRAAVTRLRQQKKSE